MNDDACLTSLRGVTVAFSRNLFVANPSLLSTDPSYFHSLRRPIGADWAHFGQLGWHAGAVLVVAGSQHQVSEHLRRTVRRRALGRHDGSLHRRYAPAHPERNI